MAVVAAVAMGGCSVAATVKTHTTGSSAVTTTTLATPTTTRPRPPRHPRLYDGSLGNQATRLACTLLSQDEIRAQFGGPVGPPTPTYPYCQWLVGSTAFLALSVEPGVPFQAATQYVDTLQTVSGLGQKAIIANNRYLYFTASGTTYWLLWQKVGDFSDLNTGQLVALGHDVLADVHPTGVLSAPAIGPAGPPVYFAGDSTAAGPEWAWGAYHITQPELRTLSEYQVGSGLVVSQYFNWQRHLLAVVAARRPRLVIYMGSANDGQELLVHGAYQPVGSPLWRAQFANKVGSIMAEILREGTHVLWIGEPAMQDPQLSADMHVIDEVYAAEAASHPGVTFVNPGAVLDGPNGTYTGTLLIGGQQTEVRLDGVHLNAAGSVVLADYIAPYVFRILGLKGPKSAAR